VYAIGAAGLGSLIQLQARGEPLYHVFPNILFFTPFYNRAPDFYQNPEDVLPEKRDRVRIHEIQASEYSYAYLEKFSEGFTKRVIIKGLFSDTKTSNNWTKPGYLKNMLGDMPVGVYKNISEGLTLTMLSAGIVADDIVTNEDTQNRFIFPQMALAETNGTDPKVAAKLVKELMDDLNLERIRSGFGSKAHTNLIGQQFFMGRNLGTPGGYKGVDWHTEPGNNWFVQVAGKKRWFVMSPTHSALMLPKIKTSRLILSSDMERIYKLEHRMPVMYGDVEAGDVLFNPEWWWHRTQVYPGVSISVPMREFYLLRNCLGSPMYSAQLFFNIFYEMQVSTFIWPFVKKWAGFS